MAAISNLPDMATLDDITDVLRNVIREGELAEKTSDSCFDRMKDYIGCVKASEDLSVNKSYMKGYGNELSGCT
jgi:hypothetical protein